MNNLINTRNNILQRIQLLILVYNNEADAYWYQYQFALQTNDQRITFRK